MRQSVAHTTDILIKESKSIRLHKVIEYSLMTINKVALFAQALFFLDRNNPKGRGYERYDLKSKH